MTPFLNSFVLYTVLLSRLTGFVESISQKAFLISMQTWDSALYHLSCCGVSYGNVCPLCSHFVARGLEAAVSVSLGQLRESALCQKTGSSIVALAQSYRGSLLCSLLFNYQLSPLCGRSSLLARHRQLVQHKDMQRCFGVLHTRMHT